MREAGTIAYAKVNFTLDILDKRPDGYHEIRSIMQTISLADGLHIRLGSGSRGIKLNVTGEHAAAAPADDTNLVVRAVRAVLAEVDIDEQSVNIEIDLEKGIPAQAGLGGGSSDAAAALTLTSRFLDLDLSQETLTRLAAGLGSDVPFFLNGDTCLVEGVGEKVTPLGSRLCTMAEQKHLVICKPDVSVSTAHAYAELDLARESSSVRYDATSAWLSAFEAGRELPLWNDFEPVILKLYPEIARSHALMIEAAATLGASRPLLCGSGAALFCLADDEASGQVIARKLGKGSAGWVTVARTCGGTHDLL